MKISIIGASNTPSIKKGTVEEFNIPQGVYEYIKYLQIKFDEIASLKDEVNRYKEIYDIIDHAKGELTKDTVELSGKVGYWKRSYLTAKDKLHRRNMQIKDLKARVNTLESYIEDKEVTTIDQII